MEPEAGLSLPLTPGGVLVRRPMLLVAVVGALLALVASVVEPSGFLTSPDRWFDARVVETRHPLVVDVLRVVTELGGGWVVLPVALVTAAVVVRRSPVLAAMILVAVAARYGFESVLKEVIGRARPTGGPLTEASGFSFPSGHALGATVGWGTVPAAVIVLTSSRRAWRTAVLVWGVVTLGVGLSRVYLGVHWVTDTVASVLVGLLLLAVVDALVGWWHARSELPRPDAPSHAPTSAGGLPT